MKEVHGVDEVKEQLNKEQEDVITSWKKICFHLDRLANFYYTPKPDLEIKPRANVPAIEMEEALPVTVSEAQGLAPEEIYAKKQKEVKGESEITQQDRKKNRKHKKDLKQKIKAEKDSEFKLKQKLNPKLKTSKQKAEENLIKDKQRVCFSK